MAENTSRIKFYQRTKVINGVEYTAQFNGMSAALDAIDENYIDNSSNISIKKLAKHIFDNVIIEPKGLTPDDFESIDDMNEVIKWASAVMQGKFRDKE